MEKLGSYELTGHLSAENAGYSVWGFGKKNGKDYFIKQFLSPKYPENDTVSSPERLAKTKKKCERFEQKKAAIYKMLNDNSDGNAVRVEEFFRVESKYYISMRKIEALPWDIEAVASLSEKEKKFLCSIIAHGIAGLHKGHIVHADLKHDNILFMKSSSGYVTAKIIDFDSGFLETDPPTEGEEIVGDQVYFSPEACKTFMGETPELTCKMDIFALGTLFHQYFSGTFPLYDESLGGCAGEVAAKGGQLTVSKDLPCEIHDLLERMLQADPNLRPTALEVYAAFAGKTVEEVEQREANPESKPSEKTIAPKSEKSDSAKVADSTTTSNPFFRPGDLL